MKYYSEITKQVYDTEAACYAAERKEKAKTDQRKKAAEKVEEARKKLAEARNEYETVLADFCKKYGAYHTSIDLSSKDEWPDLKSLVNSFLF